MLRALQLFRGLLHLSNATQQESESVLQKTSSVLWIMQSTVFCLATKHDDNAQGYLPYMLSVGQRVKVFPSCSFLLYFMVLAIGAVEFCAF